MNALAGLLQGGLTPQSLTIVVGVLTLTVALLLVFGLAGGKEAKLRAKRIQRLKQPEAVARKGDKKISVKRNSADSSIVAVDKLIKRLLPNPQKLRDRLMRTGRTITVGQYLFVCFGLTLAAAGFNALWLKLPLTAAVAGGLSTGIMLPHFVIGRMASRRQKKFNQLFPEAIDLIVRGLKSGLPVTESIKTVGNEITAPVGEEFRQISDHIKFGLPLDEALWMVAPRIDLPEFRFFIITLSIQQETGGNLAETLENLANVLRRRKQMRLKIKAFSSEAKASAMIIGSLPFIMFGLILMVNYGYASLLFTDPRGIILIAAGLTSFMTGILVMAKMIKFDI